MPPLFDTMLALGATQVKSFFSEPSKTRKRKPSKAGKVGGRQKSGSSAKKSQKKFAGPDSDQQRTENGPYKSIISRSM